MSWRRASRRWNAPNSAYAEELSCQLHCRLSADMGTYVSTADGCFLPMTCRTNAEPSVSFFIPCALAATRERILVGPAGHSFGRAVGASSATAVAKVRPSNASSYPLLTFFSVALTETVAFPDRLADIVELRAVLLTSSKASLIVVRSTILFGFNRRRGECHRGRGGRHDERAAEVRANPHDAHEDKNRDGYRDACAQCRDARVHECAAVARRGGSLRHLLLWLFAVTQTQLQLNTVQLPFQIRSQFVCIAFTVLLTTRVPHKCNTRARTPSEPPSSSTGRGAARRRTRQAVRGSFLECPGQPSLLLGKGDRAKFTLRLAGARTV